MRRPIFAAAIVAAAGSAGHAGTIQEAFDAATAAYSAGRWADAAAAYTALAARAPPHGRSAAIIGVRHGVALGRLGQSAAAAAMLTDALAALPGDDASLAVDRYEGQLALAKADEATFAPVAARSAFMAAEQIAPDADARLNAIAATARVETYLDPAAAVVTIDRALALAPSAAPGKPVAAQLHTIRGRALLNAGQVAAARSELNRAVDLLGGLGFKVGFADVAARSDLAIAALLAGDKADAKRYLAYSGAGTLDDGFARGANMEPPDCGAATGLRPDDVAVIEFGIGSDGTVAFATPVYVSRPGPQTVEFARAVAGWSWAPDKLAKIPPLLRATTRIELRCSTASERPTMAAGLDVTVRRWFAAQGAAISSTGVAATDLVAARRQLNAGTAMTAAAAQFAIADNGAAPEAERRAAAAAWSSAVLAADPPPMVRVAARLAGIAAAEKPSRPLATPPVAGLVDDPAVAADPAALNTLRLLLADRYLQRRAPAAARPLAAAVIADGRLSPADPLRAAAQLRLSAIALAAGDVAAARAAFEATGLSEAQCALTEPAPVVTRRSASANDYPPEAIDWRISGWAVTELDIRADGTTDHVRTTVAYPPFVFGPPTVKIGGSARFTASYRPNGGAGCSGWHITQGYRVL